MDLPGQHQSGQRAAGLRNAGKHWMSRGRSTYVYASDKGFYNLAVVTPRWLAPQVLFVNIPVVLESTSPRRLALRDIPWRPRPRTAWRTEPFSLPNSESRRRATPTMPSAIPTRTRRKTLRKLGAQPGPRVPGEWLKRAPASRPKAVAAGVETFRLREPWQEYTFSNRTADYANLL